MLIFGKRNFEYLMNKLVIPGVGIKFRKIVFIPIWKAEIINYRI